MNFEDLPLEDILRKEWIAESIKKKDSVHLKNTRIKNNSCEDNSFGKFDKISSKNLPLEVSSRKQSLPEKLENERNYIRNKYENIKRKNDPRFNESCGKLNTDLFQKSYEFIDAIRREEINELKNTLNLYKAMNRSKQLGTWSKDKKTAKFKNSNISQLTEEDIDEIKLKYQKLTSEVDRRKNLFLKQKTISTHRKQEQLKVQQGKKPFFLKKKEINLNIKHEKYKNMNDKQKVKLEKKLNKKQMSKFKPPRSFRSIN